MDREQFLARIGFLLAILLVAAAFKIAEYEWISPLLFICAGYIAYPAVRQLAKEITD